MANYSLPIIAKLSTKVVIIRVQRELNSHILSYFWKISAVWTLNHQMVIGNGKIEKMVETNFNRIVSKVLVALYQNCQRLSANILASATASASKMLITNTSTKVIRDGRVGQHSIVSYSRPSLMIIALASQFHVYLPWGPCLFSLVSYGAFNQEKALVGVFPVIGDCENRV